MMQHGHQMAVVLFHAVRGPIQIWDAITGKVSLSY